jgi:hypothetical protein
MGHLMCKTFHYSCLLLTNKVISMFFTVYLNFCNVFSFFPDCVIYITFPLKYIVEMTSIVILENPDSVIMFHQTCSKVVKWKD